MAYEDGSTQNFEVDVMLKERELVLSSIKQNLLRAQAIMKSNADKHQRDLEFQVGEQVYLKLRPYRQQSVSRRLFQKLAARYYGPFEVLARIGKVAYRLALPECSKIHPVFHISQLKPVVGASVDVTPLTPILSGSDDLLIEPEEVLDKRYDEEGYLEVVVKWKHLPEHESSWLRVGELKQQFPSFSPVDKLNLAEGGIDMPLCVYTRKRRVKEGSKKTNEDQKNDELALAVESGRSVNLMASPCYTSAFVSIWR